MEYLHYPVEARPGDLVEVVIDRAANVLLLDAPNYSHYTSGQPFQYQGGYAEVSPYRIQPPHPGQWHLVVDLGGGAGSVRVSVQVVPKLRRAFAEPAVR